MKTCNNCGTLNEVLALHCTGCKMPGNFTAIASTEPEDGDGMVGNVQCLNCGAFNAGNGTHCLHCRIPLKQVRVKPLNNRVFQENRKIG